MQITLDLTEHQAQQITQKAEREQQTIDQFVKNAVLDKLGYPSQHDRDLMDQEIAAYHRLHPSLVETHFGHHVAIFQGELVDSSNDRRELLDRINKKYPDDIVLIRKIEKEPERILHFRSNRLIRE